MRQTESNLLGTWLMRAGVITLMVTAVAPALLSEFGLLVFESLLSGSYTSNEFPWERGWLTYVGGAAALAAGFDLLYRERTS